MDDKIYLFERANKAATLARQTEALAAEAADNGGAHSPSSRSPAPAVGVRGFQSIRSELNSEIKKNLAAMHALLEEKFR